MSTEKYLEERAHQKLLYVSRMPFPKHSCFDFHAGLHHDKVFSCLGQLRIYFPCKINLDKSWL